ncbi:Nuclear distribution protein pac-1a [Drechmeria coniospora]|uniref:Nuclear distribution protein PAC1 n=1 Tax=Drechmeria coniospora TaxID=98403 RepID=A0A151GW27_DRECN|nr:Nuclear distribution protein pac-1a [Drechmeria coniospora]KYK61317.1 Nuclear distribution protein pac-1a [Drechmeria coniospora]ODA81081.1 hypothetical protein RJ55_04044 [Drechmeria coniospora]
MSRTLPSRQAEELNKSIIAYLVANNLPNAAAALRQEASLGEDVFDAATTKKYESLLEKKWTSIVRLQKKIMDLESRNGSLQSELDNATPTSLARRNQDPASWLPRLPSRHTLESHRDTITCIAFHPRFSSIASGSDDCTIKIWDWELGELEQTIKGHTRAVLGVDYGGPRGATLLASCSSDLSIKIWDPADQYKNIRTLQGHDHSVSAVRFLPSASGAQSGNLLVSASGDKTLRIWDATTGYCLKALKGHSGWVRDVCPSLDGQFVLSTAADHTARLWDVSTPNPEGKVVMTGHENLVRCGAFAPPASYKHLARLAGLTKAPPATSTAEFMATGSRDKTIRLWDARGTCIKTLVGHDNWITSLVFHPGGKHLLSVADDKSLRCWDLSQDGKCVKVLDGAHGHFITCMRWAPSISREVNGGGADQAEGEATAESIRCVIATGSVDKTLKIFAN